MVGIILGIVGPVIGFILYRMGKKDIGQLKDDNTHLKDQLSQLEKGNKNLQDQLKTLILIFQSLIKPAEIKAKSKTAAELANKELDRQSRAARAMPFAFTPPVQKIKPEDIEAIMVGDAETIVTETGLLDPKTDRWYFLPGDDKKYPIR